MIYIIVQEGKTPLQHAKEGNQHETVKFLESYLQEVHNNLYGCK